MEKAYLLQNQLIPKPARLPEVICPLIDHSDGADLHETIAQTPKLKTTYSKIAAVDSSRPIQNHYQLRKKASSWVLRSTIPPPHSQPTDHLAFLFFCVRKQQHQSPGQSPNFASAFPFTATETYKVHQDYAGSSFRTTIYVDVGLRKDQNELGGREKSRGKQLEGREENTRHEKCQRQIRKMLLGSH